MNDTLGIDLGGSTTKLAVFCRGQLTGTLQLPSVSNPETALRPAADKLLQSCQTSLQEISAIAVTGVGASLFSGNLFDIPTAKISEFDAIGTGGLALSGLSEALVVSMGTGTALVQASKKENRHIGGSGVGGGALLGLAAKLTGSDRFDTILSLAKNGDLGNVDLRMCDICKEEIGALSSHVTAANFGKIEKNASPGDLLLGLLNLIYQTAGTLAVFASLDTPGKTIVVTGSLATLPQAELFLGQVGSLYGRTFLIPQNAAFATAVGAAICAGL